MNESLEKQYVDISLNLLLGRDDESLLDHPLLNDIKWGVLLDVAQENRITIRLYNRLMSLGIRPDEIFLKAVNERKTHIITTIDLMGKITKLCEKPGIDFIFMKNYQHYPDMGDDIDLLVTIDSELIDSAIINNFRAKPIKRSLLNRIGGKTQYIIPGYPELEIHHGRMGPMGEHTVFPYFLMRNRMTVKIDDVYIFVPSPEDQFIIQVLQRVYGRFCLRISELVYAVNAISMESFDWDYIIETAKSFGIFDGLRFYLTCVEQIHRNVMKKSLPLIKPELSVPEHTAVLRFKDFHYRLPMQAVARNLYTKKIWSDIRASRWKTVGRTCLLPFFSALVACKVMARCWSVKVMR